MSPTTTPYRIVTLPYTITAVYEHRTYNLVTNPDGTRSVNDIASISNIRITFAPRLFNVPEHPTEAQQSGYLFIDNTPNNHDALVALGLPLDYYVDGDERHIYINDDNGDPCCELTLLGYDHGDQFYPID